MKIFSNENGRDVIYIQYSDLRLLNYSQRTPENIKKLIPIEACSSIYMDEYMKFDNKELIEWVRDIYFILDFNKFSKMSKEELYTEYKESEIKLERILQELKKIPKKQRKNQKGLYQAYEALEHYKNQILKFIQSKELNLPDGKKYIYKK